MIDMIRFIDIGTQIMESKKFAFYDTVTDRFCTFSGSQTWETRKEFISDYDGDDLLRYIILMPTEQTENGRKLTKEDLIEMQEIWKNTLKKF
jgi:hypothetical protein